MPTSFDAVFYSGPAPSSLRTLTLLALILDRVHFPGVYIPTEGLDHQETIREINRIRALAKTNDLDDIQLLNAMVYALHARELTDFCVFPGKFGYAGTLEPGAEELTKEFERLLYGPPPEGFFPTYTMGFAKSLPGGPEAAVNGPSWLSYPPNAVLYASRNDLVLINDNPHLPILATGSVTMKGNAKALATILALESVRLVLPNVAGRSFAEIAEFRDATKEIAAPFRLAMLRLSKELNAAILSDASLDDVRREAKFLVETTVLPDLEEFRRQIAEPTRPWHRRLVDMAKQIPELAAGFATLPAPIATAKVLAALAGVLADVRDDQLAREGQLKRGVYHYLLKLESLGA